MRGRSYRKGHRFRCGRLVVGAVDNFGRTVRLLAIGTEQLADLLVERVKKIM